jgi:hypothetical protein
VFKKSRGWAEDSLLQRVLIGYPLTFLAIVVTLTLFRSDNIGVAGQMISAMAGLDGIAVKSGWGDWKIVQWLAPLGVTMDPEAAPFFSAMAVQWVFVCGLIVWLLPNTYQLFDKEAVALETYRLKPWWGEGRYLAWQPNVVWMLGVTALALLGIDALNNVSEFLYFQF